MTAFNNMKLKYQNESVAQLVENSSNPVRIVEWNGKLIQKVYPIYFDDHRPANQFDFRGSFYIPKKYFMGEKWDTFYFNITIIWIMTIFLYMALYFEWIRKIVVAIENRLKYSKD